MIQLKRILCPVDFSSCSKAALDHAIALAELHHADLDVLHVYWQVPTYAGVDVSGLLVGGSDESLADFVRDDAHQQLEGFLSALTERQSRRIQRRFAVGNPARAILSLLADGDYDLVVMGTHGRSGLNRLLLGSVAEKVVRAAPRPVLTISEQSESRARPNFARALVGIDFSDSSTNAAKVAIGLCAPASPRIDLVHIWDVPAHMWSFAVAGAAGMPPMPLWTFARERVQGAMTELLTRIESEAHDVMDRHRALHLRTSVDVGRAAEAIVRTAREQGHGLIVLGTHGRTGLSHLLLGSVADQVLRTAPCPVLIVPTPARPVGGEAGERF